MRKKPHFAWWVLAACCMIQGGMVGLIQNTTGIFCQVVSVDRGFDLSAVTFYTSVRVLTACALLPFTSTVRKRVSLRVLLPIATVLYTLPNFLMGMFNDLWQWYLAAAVQGAGAAFLVYTTIPILLANWFRKHLGFAMGLSSAFSGVFGVLANPFGSMLIQTCGWRMAYMVFACISAAVVLPFVLFAVRATPEEMGLKRLGEEEPGAATHAVLDTRERENRATSWVDLVFVVFLQFVTMVTMGFTQMLPSYGATQGLTPTAASLLVSFSMLGCTLGKLVLGTESDRYEAHKVALVAFSLPMLGFCLLLAGGAAAYPAAFLTGMTMPAGIVIMPMLIRRIYGGFRYERVLTIATMTGNIVWALSGPLFSRAFERSGSYAGGIALCAAVSAMAMAFIWARRIREAR